MTSRQSKNIRLQPEYHLIITEGTKTEPQYFEAVKETINKHFRDKIQLEIHGEGDNTLGLLDKAQQRVRNSGVIYLYPNRFSNRPLFCHRDKQVFSRSPV